MSVQFDAWYSFYVAQTFYFLDESLCKAFSLQIWVGGKAMDDIIIAIGLPFAFDVIV